MIWWMVGILVLGMIALLKLMMKIFSSLFFHYRRLNLKRQYPGSWGIVTGASDGIGFGFCQELAGQGYNVCLISRNREKLEQKVVELKKQFGNTVEYRVVVADFKESFKDSFFEKLVKDLDGIQPVILVNNVGISEIVLVKDQSQTSIRDIVSVNCLAQANLSAYFIRKCEQSNRKGGIINISSYSFIVAMPYMSVYAATKAFNDIFSRCTSKQSKNITTLSVRAMEVISGRVKKAPSMSVCTSRECARDSLKYLGYREVTAGHLKHEVIRHVSDAVPEWLLQKIAMGEAERVNGDYGKNKKNN